MICALAAPSAPVSAQEAQVENRCPSLETAQLEELNARVMLRLAASPEPHAPPSARACWSRRHRECMAAHPRGEAELGVAPVMGLGLRAARDFDVIGLWLGLDSRLRLGKLSAGKQDPIVANSLTASFSLGVSFLDAGRRTKRK